MIPHWVDNGGDPKAEWAGGLRVKPNVDAAWERGEIERGTKKKGGKKRCPHIIWCVPSSVFSLARHMYKARGRGLSEWFCKIRASQHITYLSYFIYFFFPPPIIFFIFLVVSAVVDYSKVMVKEEI